MNVSEQPYLIAYIRDQPYMLVNNPKNAAAFLSECRDDVRLCTPDNATIISSCGAFLDRCTNMDYYNSLILPLLVKYQLNPALTPEIQYVNNNSRNSSLSR